MYRASYRYRAIQSLLSVSVDICRVAENVCTYVLKKRVLKL